MLLLVQHRIIIADVDVAVHTVALAQFLLFKHLHCHFIDTDGIAANVVDVAAIVVIIGVIKLRSHFHVTELLLAAGKIGSSFAAEQGHSVGSGLLHTAAGYVLDCDGNHSNIYI